MLTQNFASTLFEKSSDLIITCSLGGAIIRANPAVAIHLGFQRAQVIGQSVEQFLTSASFDRLSRFLIAQGNEHSLDLDFYCENGGIKKFQSFVQIDRESRALLIVAKHLKAIDKEDVRWRLALEASDAGFWDWDLTNHQITMSPRYYELLGYQDGEFDGNFETWRAMVHPDDVERATQNIPQQIVSGSSNVQTEVRLKTKTGEYRWMHFMGSVERDSSGRATRFTGWMLDVTDVHSSREKLAEVEARSRALIQSIPDLMFVVDRNGRYLEVMTSDESMLLVPKEELVGKTLDDFFNPGLSDHFRSLIAAALDKRTMQAVEYSLTLPSGKVAHFEARLLCSSRPDEVLTIVRDQTDLKIAQEQMHAHQALVSSSSRLAALGEMAGGIAHEINNPLAVAHAHASRLGDSARAGKLDRDTVIQSTEKIESVCLRISRIIAGLRTLARDGERDLFIEASLDSIVGDALAVCSERMRHLGIELTSCEKSSRDLFIECRPVQISQILINLLSNAQHAVENFKGDRWIRIECADLGNDIELSVSDSGAGVPRNLHEKIFDPFFTTKEIGKGTGLGLSVSASIARSHNGRLFLDSHSPSTRFVMRLPKQQPGSELSISP